MTGSGMKALYDDKYLGARERERESQRERERERERDLPKKATRSITRALLNQADF